MSLIAGKISSVSFWKTVAIYSVIILASSIVPSFSFSWLAAALIGLAYAFELGFYSDELKQALPRIIIGLIVYFLLTTAAPLVFILLDISTFKWTAPSLGNVFAFILSTLISSIWGAIILSFIFPNAALRKPDGTRTAIFWIFIITVIVSVVACLLFALLMLFVAQAFS